MFSTKQDLKAYFEITTSGRIRLSISPTRNILYLPAFSIVEKVGEDYFLNSNIPLSLIGKHKENDKPSLVYRMANKGIDESVLLPENFFGGDEDLAEIKTLRHLQEEYNKLRELIDHTNSVSAKKMLKILEPFIKKLPENLATLFKQTTPETQPAASPTGIAGPALKKLARVGADATAHALPNVKGYPLREVVPNVLIGLYEKYGPALIAALQDNQANVSSEKSPARRKREAKATERVIELLQKNDPETIKKLKPAKKEDITGYSEEKSQDVLPINWAKLQKVMRVLYRTNQVNPWEEVVHQIYPPAKLHAFHIKPETIEKVKVATHGEDGKINSVETVDRINPARLINFSPAQLRALEKYNQGLEDEHPLGIPDTERYGTASHASAHSGQYFYPHVFTSPSQMASAVSGVDPIRAFNLKKGFPVKPRRYHKMLIINPSAQDSRQGALLTEHGKYEKIGLPTDGISSAKQKKKELDIKTLLKTHQGKYIKDHIIDSLYEAYNKLTEEGGANYPRYLLAATLLQAHAGSRPGRNKDSNELKQSKLYGALSLLGSHIHIKDGGKGVVVKFPGKSGVAQHIHIDDLRFVKVFDKIQKEQKKRLRQAKTQGYEVHDSNLFPGLIDKSSQQLKETLKQHLKPILQSKGIDLTEHEYDKVVTDPYAYRRAHFNLLLREIAHEAGRRLKATHTKNNQQYLSTEDYRKQRRDVFDLVSIFSGNRGETLDESYVLPGTFNTSFMAGYNSEQPSQANTEELNIEDIKKLPYAGKQTPYQENKLPSEELLNLEHADEPIKGNMQNDPLDDSEYLQVEDEGAPPETKNV